jgi:hypothetical protein
MLSDCFPILSVFYFKKNREKKIWKESEMFHNKKNKITLLINNH